MNDIDNMITVSNKIREMIIELKEIKNDLEDTRKKQLMLKMNLWHSSLNLPTRKNCRSKILQKRRNF